MPVPIFPGAVVDGNLRLQNPTRYELWIALLDGKQVEVVVKQKRNRRSDRQNRYYWGVVIKIIADHLGYEPDELHESLKRKFLGEVEDRYGLRRVASTTMLTTAEFIETYTEPIKRWAAEYLRLYIPDPNEVES